MHQPAARWRIAVTAAVVAAQLATLLAPAVAAAQTSGTAKPATPATSTTSQKQPVQQGQQYYEQSRFDEAITLLKDLTDRGALTGEDLQKARELLARSYVKKGYPVQAKEMFKAILRTDPAWRPDPIRVPPDETAVFDQALKEFQEEKPAAVPPPAGTTAPATGAAAPTTPVSPAAIGVESTKKPLVKQWWFWALGLVAVGGIAAAAGGGGGGGSSPPPDNSLPAFPTHP
jgi:hypothetical protein